IAHGNRLIFGTSKPAQAGIREGDVLVAINGVSVPDLIADNWQGTFGPIGDPVTLTVRTGDAPPRDVTMTYSPNDWVEWSAMAVGLPLNAAIAYELGLDIFLLLVFSIIAVWMAWRRSDDWMVLYAAWALMTFGVINSAVFGIGLLRQDTFVVHLYQLITIV